jgi:hypothetical protein
MNPEGVYYMFNSLMSAGFTAASVFICLVVSLLCGIAIALTYKAGDRPSRNFLLAVSVLPAIVMLVIMMVNGNIGVGVAVAGSFSLVRFRSLPGKASDIVIIFLAMGIGLITGMGYAVLAVICTVFMCAAFFMLNKAPFLSSSDDYRNLRITIPEDLDYISVFDDIFNKYATDIKLQSAKTVNLGTMYQISYELRLKNEKNEKAMIDELRTRNGNLSIVCGHHAMPATEL